MATEIATAYVSLVASTNKLAPDVRKSLGQVESDADATGGRIGGSLSSKIGSAFKVGAAATAAVGAVVAAGIGSLAVSGVKYNAAMENFQSGFSTLLGSADKAKGLLAELSSFAAKTPFEMPSLADASQTLLSFGEDAQKLMPDLKMLGDISLGNSEKLSGLALVYGQVQSQGKLMGQDLLQMINNGFNPLQIISEKTGESMASLKDKMSKGQISFEQVRQAMQDATAQGGMFFNAMDNGSRTLTGQWSTLTDGVHILSGTLVGSLSSALTSQVLPGINGVVGALGDLMNGLPGADAEVESAAQALVQGISALGPAIQTIAANFGTVFEALAPALQQAVSALVDSIGTLLPSILTLAGSIITALVEGIAANLPLVTQQAVPIIMGFVETILYELPTVLDAALAVIQALAFGIADALPSLIPQIVDVVVQMVNVLIANLPYIVQAGIALLQGLIQGLITAIPVLVGSLPMIINGIVGYFGTVVPMLVQAGLDLFMALVGALPDIVNGIVSVIPVILDALTGFLVNNLPTIIDAGIQLFTALVGALPTIITAIVGAIPVIIKAIGNFLGGPGFTALIDSGVKLFLGLVNSISTALPQIVGAVIDAIPEIVKALIDATPQIIYAGGQLIMGLVTGIAQAVPALLKGVRDTMGKVLDGIKGFFGIHSPSAVFRDEIGAMLGAGMAEGITGSADQVSSAAGSLQSAAMRSLQGFSNGLTATANLNVRGDSGAGNRVQMVINPAAGMSEEAIGDAAARRLDWASAGVRGF